MITPKVARLLGLGAIAAILPILALVALMFWVARPTPTSGLDWVHALLSCMAIGVIGVAICIVQFNFGRQLLAAARGEHPAP